MFIVSHRHRDHNSDFMYTTINTTKVQLDEKQVLKRYRSVCHQIDVVDSNKSNTKT